MLFQPSVWCDDINVRDFILRNYTPYEGNEDFLTPPTRRTRQLWEELSALMKEERARGGVYDIDPHTISTIDSHQPGYINRELETIVGLQTDEPLKRAIMPFGGYRMVKNSLKAYNKETDPQVDEINDLLARSVQLLNTDADLAGTFQEAGRLVDTLWWLDIWDPVFTRNPGKSLLENLTDFQDAMLGQAGTG